MNCQKSMTKKTSHLILLWLLFYIDIFLTLTLVSIIRSNILFTGVLPNGGVWFTVLLSLKDAKDHSEQSHFVLKSFLYHISGEVDSC